MAKEEVRPVLFLSPHRHFNIVISEFVDYANLVADAADKNANLINIIVFSLTKFTAIGTMRKSIRSSNLRRYSIELPSDKEYVFEFIIF